MKHTRMILLVFLVLAVQTAAQEYRGVTLEMTVDNGAGRTQVLALGLREGATPGIDPTMEEAELPPQPPNEIFDTRLVSTPGKSQLGLGSLADYRNFDTGTGDIKETYTIAYQAGINASGVTLSWGPEIPGRVRTIIIDGEDQSGNTSYEAQFATGQITVELTFNASALSYEANPNPMLFDVSNKDPLPMQTLTITPQGEPQATWTLATDAEWLTLNPSSGEGEGSIEVMVNTRLLPAGQYDGVITVRSLVYPAQLDVPVKMTMVVGVEETPVPGQLYLGQNYPNPFGAAAQSGSVSTRIEISLGMLSETAAPSLKIYDMLGREVMDLSADLLMQTGRQSVRFDAASLPGGVYTYSLRYAGQVRTRSMILSR